MTEYNISGDIVTVSTMVENERYVKKNTAEYINQVEKMFDGWYSSQYDCKSVYRNASDILWKVTQPMVKRGVEMLNAQGVYSLDERIFIDKYLNGYADDFYNALDIMIEKIEEIEEQKEQESAYRKARKASRGRVVGGGFGLGGAIKGMATAGMINATTGMVHSLGNAVGNMGSGIAASSNMAAVYKYSKAPLREAILKSTYNVRNGIRAALEREAGIKCKYVTVTESERAAAILKNYQQGRIPVEQKKAQIIEALSLNPYAFEIYDVIWKDYGDQNGGLRKMSSYFGGTLEQRIKSLAEEYGNDLFSKNCNLYENAIDKKEAAIQCEKQIIATRDSLIQYCNDHGISEDTISKIEKCKKLLTDIDIELRTVKGVIYESRDLAENVRKDFASFYHFLKGKNIFDSGTFENVKAIGYVTNEFRNGLQSIFEAECNLRKPDKIYENLDTLVRHTLGEDITNAGWVDIPNYIGIFQQKEAMVRTVTGMADEETPLILLDNSSNGKSGLVLTNYFLRIYSKGILSNESRFYPIEKIAGIKYLGKNEFVVSVCEQESVKFALKSKNRTEEEQITIGKMINELVILVNNLFPQSRFQLFRILNGSMICKCGTHLLTGEKICPVCKRMAKEDGEFVETEMCPNCKKIVMIGKKFCSSCGNSLSSDLDEQKIELTENVKENISNVKEMWQGTRCPDCNNLVKTGKKFCSSCGRKII